MKCCLEHNMSTEYCTNATWVIGNHSHAKHSFITKSPSVTDSLVAPDNGMPLSVALKSGA
jgi:hypothetical protein